VTEFVVDNDSKIVSTPAFMYDARISDVARGIEKLVDKIAEMAADRMPVNA
jgi:enhancing lycopene biosynthesis protein 2